MAALEGVMAPKPMLIHHSVMVRHCQTHQHNGNRRAMLELARRKRCCQARWRDKEEGGGGDFLVRTI